ncbi:MerC domain-containing protein [Glaciecola sp. 1036]|uniref:MerC domain-containing protein n=1 Tax=Alteromonadaceae TaxID=72275 RepID=UPI003D017E0E
MKPTELTSVQRDEQQRVDNTRFDKLGVWVSSLCALHCLAIPMLLPIAPFIATTFFAESWFERTILAISILIGFIALFIGFHQYHRQLYPIYSLITGALIYWNKDVFGEAYEPFTIALGAGFIIAAHLLNLKLCRQCKDCK